MSSQGKSLEEYEGAGKVTQTMSVDLDSIDSELEKRSKFLKINAKETKILEFLRETDGVNKGKIIPQIVDGEYQGQPNTRIHFRVREPKVSTTDEKILALSKKHSAGLIILLKKGKTLVEVTRQGSGRNDTNYLFAPAD